MKTGRLLDILSGHEGPVHGLMFSPSNVSSQQSLGSVQPGYHQRLNFCPP